MTRTSTNACASSRSHSAAFTERVKRYEHRRPIFDHYHIEPALRLAVSRRVPLRSGRLARDRSG